MKQLAVLFALFALFCAMAGNVQASIMPDWDYCECHYTPSTEGLSGGFKMGTSDSDYKVQRVLVFGDRAEVQFAQPENLAGHPMSMKLAFSIFREGKWVPDSVANTTLYIDQESVVHMSVRIPKGVVCPFFFTLTENGQTVWEAQITGVEMGNLDNNYLVATANGTKFDFEWEPIYG